MTFKETKKCKYEEQSKAIEKKRKKQRENKLEKIEKDDKTKDVVYLRERIDELFEIYPKSINQSMKVLAQNENIDYKNLS